MNYDYFGNTSLRVKNLLYNFEMQLILFQNLFSQANKNDVWENNSELQIRYLELLEEYKLLDSKKNTTNLGTKNARVKSAPLEDYNLIKRKQKLITPEGYELLELIANKSFKIKNEFLQIDLVSLFFLKLTLNFSKSQDLLKKYLEVFRQFNGTLDVNIFKLLPLINNFSDIEEFVSNIKNNEIFLKITPQHHLKKFIQDLKNSSLQVDYFKTAKGDKTALSILSVLQDLFLPLRQNPDNLEGLKNLISPQCKPEFLEFKKMYLKYLTKNSNTAHKLKNIQIFVCNGDLENFGKRFFNFIFINRMASNLDDYADLNRRYLSLTGIFEFSNDKVSLNEIFKIILLHSEYKTILDQISKSNITKSLLKEYFQNKEILKVFRNYGIYNIEELSTYQYNKDKQKLFRLIENKFSKKNIIEILQLFENRKNHSKIFELTTTEATIPTIFEYIIAIAWYYIDDNNLNRVLEARLSLDSMMLPKSHAIGGDADIIYHYDDHILMIEATLTENTNQRRAEMESVSRHLGNLLIDIKNPLIRKNSFGIFIAPHLDKNVLNDFRSRIYCYFEKNDKYIKGMKILPLSSNDLIKILKSGLNHQALLPKFHSILKSSNDWGSKWYEMEVMPMIKSL